MTLNNPLFVIRTGIHYKSSLELMNQVLYNNSSVYISLYHDKNLHDIYYKCLSLFKNKSYHKFIDHIFYDSHNNLNINLENILYLDNRFKKFSHFIYLDSCNIYFPGFFQYVRDLDDDIDIYTIKSYQSIDLNLRIGIDHTKQIKVINKKTLEFLSINNQTDIYNLPQSFKHKEIRNNNFIVTENKNISKHNIQEPKFKLLYLTEDKNSILKDSYCFFYQENSKCMNIDNSVVGNFTLLNDNQIMVNWNHNGSIFAHRYAMTEDNNYYRVINVDH